MIEVVAHNASLGYSGDTYNAAVYLRRCSEAVGQDLEVRYLSGVGSDQESSMMRARWNKEGIGDDALSVEGRGPGIYVIRTDGDGERVFSYWRDASAAAVLFVGTEWVEHVKGDYLYLSGISLQLMSAASRSAFANRLDDLRCSGSQVVFDSNYRPTGWSSAAVAGDVMDAMLRHVDIALVTLDDEKLLTGCDDVRECIMRLHGLGVREVVVKDGANGSWVSADGEMTHIPAPQVVVIDTTAAGDSFNGAYLAARIGGARPSVAAREGNLLASTVIQHRGAIIKADSMPLRMRV